MREAVKTDAGTIAIEQHRPDMVEITLDARTAGDRPTAVSVIITDAKSGEKVTLNWVD